MNEIKTDDKKILFILLITLLSSFLINKDYYIIIFIILNGILFFTIGYKKDKYKYKIDSIQLILIYNFSYLIIIYLSGIFLGYTKSPYSLEIIKIFKNISPIFITIILEEIFRYIILKKTNNKFIIFFLFLTLLTFDIVPNIKFYELKTELQIFEAIGIFFVPAIMKQILCIYLTYNGSIYPCIIYRLINELYVFFVPVIPDLGIYFESILNIIFPTILIIRFSTLFYKKTYKKKKNFIKTLLYMPFFAFVLAIVILSSNKFQHSILSIGSNSMSPKIKKGDVVIIEKKGVIKKIDIGDVIAFKEDNKIIIHRVVEIYIKNNKYIFKTKGDNNNSVDNFEVFEESIIGKVNFTLKYLGYPSVWLSEKLAK